MSFGKYKGIFAVENERVKTREGVSIGIRIECRYVKENESVGARVK